VGLSLCGHKAGSWKYHCCCLQWCHCTTSQRRTSTGWPSRTTPSRGVWNLCLRCCRRRRRKLDVVVVPSWPSVTPGTEA